MLPTKIGLIGAGNISSQYLRANSFYKIIDIVAIADIDLEKARARAEEFNIPRACTPEELLADSAIEIVVNLTIPAAHFEVSRSILNAGKHVYVEKPLCMTREQGAEIVEIASKKGLRIGCAPDTFLGGGQQTCRKLIDDGWIGAPIGATAFMLCHGHESWHPSPAFYYQTGGGPMLDMGPYYLTALVNLLGPIESVAGSARITYPERTITSKPLAGTKVTVETPTHIAGVLNFASGAIGTILTSFDVWSSEHRNIEIYGSEGSMLVPDPNGFMGAVKVRRMGASEWSEIPLARGHKDEGRGTGVADLAYALRSGRPHRANGSLAFHVLDAMYGILDASESGRRYRLSTQAERPAALPLGIAPGELDD